MTEAEQTWGEPDVDELNDDLANSYTGYTESWQPQPGDGNKIRACPPKPGAKFYQRVDFHYGIGPKNRTFPCARSVDEDEACALCDIADQLKASDDPVQQAEYKQVRAKKRYLIAIVDINAKDKGIQVWRAPTTCWRDIVMIIRDPDWGNITHPTTGRNIKVIKTGQKLNTDYTIQVLPNPTKFPLEMSALEELPDLLDTVTFADDTEMESAYYDEGDGEEGDGYEVEPEAEGDEASAEEVPAEGDGEEGVESEPEGVAYQPEEDGVAPEAEEAVAEEPAEEAAEAEPAEEAAAEEPEPAPARPRRPAPTPRRTAPARAAAKPAAAKVERAPVGRPLKPQTAKATRPAPAPAKPKRTEVRRKAAAARSR
jgi:hypothetical protein